MMVLLLLLLLFHLIPNVMWGSMYDDIRLRVSRSYTASADSPLSLIVSVTLSNHLFLGLPSPVYFHFNRTTSYVALITYRHMDIPLQTPFSCIQIDGSLSHVCTHRMKHYIYLNHDDSSFICR